jgi:hypothetical protein
VDDTVTTAARLGQQADDTKLAGSQSDSDGVGSHVFLTLRFSHYVECPFLVTQRISPTPGGRYNIYKQSTTHNA